MELFNVPLAMAWDNTLRKRNLLTELDASAVVYKMKLFKLRVESNEPNYSLRSSTLSSLPNRPGEKRDNVNFEM
jgi:hypothetical protein